MSPCFPGFPASNHYKTMVQGPAYFEKVIPEGCGPVVRPSSRKGEGWNQRKHGFPRENRRLVNNNNSSSSNSNSNSNNNNNNNNSNSNNNNNTCSILPSTWICCISYQRPSTHHDKEPNLLVIHVLQGFILFSNKYRSKTGPRISPKPGEIAT